MKDKNFDIVCQLAGDLYFQFIDTLDDSTIIDYVIDDKDNIGCTKNTDKGMELYFNIENTIKEALDKMEVA